MICTYIYISCDLLSLHSTHRHIFFNGTLPTPLPIFWWTVEFLVGCSSRGITAQGSYAADDTRPDVPYLPQARVPDRHG